MLFRKYQTFLVKNAEGRTGKNIFAFFNKHLFAGVHNSAQADSGDSDGPPLDDQLENFQQGIDEVDALDLQALTLSDSTATSTCLLTATATTTATSAAIITPTTAVNIPTTATTVPTTATTTIIAVTANPGASLDVEASQRQMESIPEEDEVEVVELGSAPQTEKPRPRPKPKPTPKSKPVTSRARKQPTESALGEVDNEGDENESSVGTNGRKKRSKQRAASSGSR